MVCSLGRRRWRGFSRAVIGVRCRAPHGCCRRWRFQGRWSRRGACTVSCGMGGQRRSSQGHPVQALHCLQRLGNCPRHAETIGEEEFSGEVQRLQGLRLAGLLGQPSRPQEASEVEGSPRRHFRRLDVESFGGIGWKVGLTFGRGRRSAGRREDAKDGARAPRPSLRPSAPRPTFVASCGHPSLCQVPSAVSGSTPEAPSPTRCRLPSGRPSAPRRRAAGTSSGRWPPASPRVERPRSPRRETGRYLFSSPLPGRGGSLTARSSWLQRWRRPLPLPDCSAPPAPLDPRTPGAPVRSGGAGGQ
mmetsp:Transcript_66350/g.214440  ORF Transcript_66350/g.214440 Transcript_66350/m.214440 type:complete len:302 (-) Transcript_66350:11-916(-)